MTAHRPRFRRVANWLSPLVCIMCLLGMAASLKWEAAVGSYRVNLTERRSIVLKYGAIVIAREVDSVGDMPNFFPEGNYVVARSRDWERFYAGWREYGAVPHYERWWNGTWWITIPLWMPLIVSAIATVLLWRADRRHSSGTCQRCGYDLRATPERCPECGHTAEVPK